MLAFVCFACTDEMEADGNSKERSVKLQLQLSLPMDASARTTRMTSCFEAGSKYENYINFDDVHSYRIYFFDTNNNYIARFIPSKTVMAEATEYTLYSVEGEVPEDVLQRASNNTINTMDFKIVVLANWENYEEPEAESKLETICNAYWAQFEIKSFKLGEENLIPFYGVNEYEDVPVQYGGTITLEESIPLLRAMAKVEVVLNKEDELNTEEMSFSHVTLHGYNSKGYCAPMNGAYPQNGHILHLIGDQNEEGSINKTIPFLQTQSDNKKETWIAYVPEYDNTSKGANAAYIELRFDIQTETDEKDFVIHFADDQTDIEKTSFDITRNHLYRFNVTIDPKGNLAVEVNDWEKVFNNEFYF
ncbi:hypothetical protein B5F78_13355 [Bacteroides sp. An279]|nr:hypothetical protein B5F78_13355 [Bacteroides sp. An279]